MYPLVNDTTCFDWFSHVGNDAQVPFASNGATPSKSRRGPFHTEITAFWADFRITAILGFTTRPRFCENALSFTIFEIFPVLMLATHLDIVTFRMFDLYYLGCFSNRLHGLCTQFGCRCFVAECALSSRFIFRLITKAYTWPTFKKTGLFTY